MIGAQIKTMLEEEIEASGEYSRRNFGLSTGEDFREMVEEAVKSRKVTANLILNTLMVGLAGPKLAEWMKANETASKDADALLSNAILSNLTAFKGPLEFLYWGIQIGRKLARQEAETLKTLETESTKSQL